MSGLIKNRFQIPTLVTTRPIEKSRLLTPGRFHSNGFGGRLLGKTDLLVAGKLASSNSRLSRRHSCLISLNVLPNFIAQCFFRFFDDLRGVPLTHSTTQNKAIVDIRPPRTVLTLVARVVGQFEHTLRCQIYAASCRVTLRICVIASPILVNMAVHANTTSSIKPEVLLHNISQRRHAVKINKKYCSVL